MDLQTYPEMVRKALLLKDSLSIAKNIKNNMIKRDQGMGSKRPQAVVETKRPIGQVGNPSVKKFRDGGSGLFAPPPPRVVGRSASAPPVFVPSASTVPEAEDAVSLPEGGGSFYDGTLWESSDPTLWRERTSTWTRRDYWQGLCNIWATDRWQKTSTTMKVNRATNLEANKHTSGSVFFATHQSRLESYSQQMTEKYAGEEEQPQLYPKVWVTTSGAPKKDHVYGFGHRMNTSRVLSGDSSSGLQTTSASTTPGVPGTSPSVVMGFIRDDISGLESRLVHMMHTQMSDAVQAQLSQALSKAISQALSLVNIPPQAVPSTSARAPYAPKQG
ncbi:hypothetical protein Taro_051009 [Colocasia esculenta]|uniref:Uncharacterized protein n=1 Tax=Colocasia esculenta TaxID=4460 RepID=A0A843XFC5_COLES|nr:hypothetical protein [Colocasia esculenta]